MAEGGNCEVLPEAAKENQKLKRKAKNHSAKFKTKKKLRMNTKERRQETGARMQKKIIAAKAQSKLTSNYEHRTSNLLRVDG